LRLEDRSAEGHLLRVIQLVLLGLLACRLVWRELGPAVVGQVQPIATGEDVAATLGDGVDHTAGEAAVLGADAGREYLRLFHRVFDVERVGVAEQVVVHVDAVDEERVVVGERSGDRQLPAVGRVAGEAGRHHRDLRERAAERQRVHFLRAEVGAGGGGGDCGFDGVGGHLHLLGEASGGEGRVHLFGKTELHGRFLLNDLEAAQLEFDDVVTGRHGADDVDAVGVGGGVACALQGGGRDRHTYTGEHETARIRHRSLNRPGLYALCVCELANRYHERQRKHGDESA